MPKARAHTHTFNVGEMSQSALARTDQEKLRLAAETQENIFGKVIGAGIFRPGTTYIGASQSNNRARALPFIKSATDTAVLELTTGKLRVWVSDALVTRPSVTSTVGNGTFGTASATITVTIASPGVVTWTAHGLSAGTPVSFKTTGALPTGITAGTTYYVQATGLTTDTFRISATNGGADINTSGSQSGTHTGDAYWVTTITSGGTSTITANTLVMYSAVRGGTALARQAVTTSSANTQHALRIVVTRGTMGFRCGSSAGADDYIPETNLDEGTHSLTFTPTGATYYVEFYTKSETAVIVTNCTVEAAGVLSLDAPWSESDLRLIRYDQSGDIVFLACTSWQQRKIERRNNTTSWSLVKFKTNDGPFTTAKTADVKLTPGALSGNTTLTSDRPFFKSTHVGALFKVFHEGQKTTTLLGADNTWSDPVRISGASSSVRVWSVVVSGAVSNLSVQASTDGATTGFVTTSTSAVGNGTTSQSDSGTGAIWYRYGFLTGTYVSGTATVTITAGGGGGHGIARVVAFTSSTSVEIEVLEPFLGLGASGTWYEGEWSDKRGWPTAVSFHDGRLGWSKGDKFWLSESDAYYTFGRDDDESVTDASAIARSIATSGAVNSVNWMLSLQRLILGTQGAESVARANSFDEPITPTNTQIKDASTQGSAAISPVRFDKRGMYVQRAGTRVYEIFYNFEQQDYDSSDLMEMHETIGGDGILELFVQRQPQPYLWCVRADGQCPILVYEPKQKVMGWQRFITDGEVESGCVLPGTAEDAVYLFVKRTINGSTVRYFEKVAKHSEAVGGAVSKMADAGALTVGSSSSVTLAHLANETDLVAWATNGSGVQVALTGLSANGSGVISLGGTYTNIWCGLKYRWRYKSAKLAFGAQGGTALLQRKRVGPIGILAEYIHPDSVTFGPSFDTLDPLPEIEDGTDTGTSVRSTYDQIGFPFEGEWDTDARVCMEGYAPYPVTLNALVMIVETNE